MKNTFTWVSQVDFTEKRNILELKKSIAGLLVLVWKIAPSLVFIHSQVKRFLENRSCIIQTRGGLIWKHGKRNAFLQFQLSPE